MSIAFVFEVVLLALFGCFGILGNCLLIRLFVNMEVKVNFHKLMIALAIYDTTYILLSIGESYMPKIFKEYKTEGYQFYIAPMVLPIMEVLLTGSIYFTVGISLERYLTVCHPFFMNEKKWSEKRYIIPIIICCQYRCRLLHVNFIGN